ncbi:MAG: hypothetical protein ABR562_02385, partial [Thermoplasmatota archaeon]
MVGRGVLLLVAVLAAAPSASASSAVLLPTVVPSEGYAISAASDGSSIWVLHGTPSWYQTAIERFDPATGGLQTMGATIPGAMHRHAAVWTGSSLLVFVEAFVNGTAASPLVGRMYRYAPATSSVTMLAETWPLEPAMFWDGDYAYLLGGCTAAACPVVRFDPLSASFATMPYSVPGSAGSVAWDGQSAYYFSPLGAGAGHIYQVTPAQNVANDLGALLPAMDGHSAAWMGGRALIFYGSGSNVPDDRVRGYDPSTGALGLDPTYLPPFADSPAAVARNPCQAYVFGIRDANTTDTGVALYDACADAGNGTCGPCADGNTTCGSCGTADDGCDGCAATNATDGTGNVTADPANATADGPDAGTGECHGQRDRAGTGGCASCHPVRDHDGGTRPSGGGFRIGRGTRLRCGARHVDDRARHLRGTDRGLLDVARDLLG